jgi:hypothetical protein
VGDEVGLELLTGFDYLRVRGKDWVDCGRFRIIFNADVGVVN